jgi:hypothetical protein
MSEVDAEVKTDESVEKAPEAKENVDVEEISRDESTGKVEVNINGRELSFTLEEAKLLRETLNDLCDPAPFFPLRRSIPSFLVNTRPLLIGW